MFRKRGDGREEDDGARKLQDPLLVRDKASSTLKANVPLAQAGAFAPAAAAPPLPHSAPPGLLWAPDEPYLLQPEAIGHCPVDTYVNISSGDVPKKYTDATRKARLATLDKQCDDAHREHDPSTYSGFDVTQLLAPGERIVFSFPCIGFVNFPE
jgi:hypothetical protein